MKTKLILLIAVLTFQFGFSQEPTKYSTMSIDSVKLEPLKLDKQTKADEKAKEKVERERLKTEKDKANSICIQL